MKGTQSIMQSLNPPVDAGSVFCDFDGTSYMLRVDLLYCVLSSFRS
jgi:hypothetical protein